MNEKCKEELNFYIKQYEIFSKFYDEQIKLIFVIPTFVAAFFFTLKDNWNNSMTIVPILFVAIVWGHILFEINSLRNYRKKLEIKINDCFNKEVITYEIKISKLTRKKSLKRRFLLVINVIATAFYLYCYNTYPEFSIYSLMIVVISTVLWLLLNSESAF